MFILDTNVISELRKATTGKADAAVTSWAASQDPDHLFLSAITVMELEMGVLRLERRDRAQAMLLRRWLRESVLPGFHDRILEVDVSVALCCATLHVPDPRPERDGLIAATALVHAMTLVTRNTRDFAGTGVPLLNPWRPAVPP